MPHVHAVVIVLNCLIISQNLTNHFKLQIMKRLMEQKEAQIETPTNLKSTKQRKCDSNINLAFLALRHIFQYLDVCDLTTAKKVCRSWLEAANEEERRRGPYCIVEYCGISMDETKSKISYLVNQTRVTPYIALFFMSNDIFQTPAQEPDLLSHIYDLLPTKKCKAVILSCAGSVFINNEKNDYPISNAKELRNVGYAFLPQMINNNVTMMEFHVKESLNMENSNCRKLINQWLDEKNGPNCETSTCIMSFGSWRTHHVNYLRNLYATESERIDSYWACEAFRVYCMDTDIKAEPEDRKHYEASDVIILISGAICTWSVALNNKKYNTKEKIESRLKLFKDRTELKQYSMGFMFTTVWQSNFDKRNEEATIFKKLFPKVPLFGCFMLSATFSKNMFEDIYEAEEYNRRRYIYRSVTDTATVFMILTYD